MTKTEATRKFQVTLMWSDETTEFKVEVASDSIDNAIDKAMMEANTEELFSERELELRGAKEI